VQPHADADQRTAEDRATDDTRHRAEPAALDREDQQQHEAEHGDRATDPGQQLRAGAVLAELLEQRLALRRGCGPLLLRLRPMALRRHRLLSGRGGLL
jgi:hypothetical protein